MNSLIGKPSSAGILQGTENWIFVCDKRCPAHLNPAAKEKKIKPKPRGAWHSRPRYKTNRIRSFVAFLYPLFFTSGIPALLYQVVWQRSPSPSMGPTPNRRPRWSQPSCWAWGWAPLSAGWAASRWPTQLLIIYGVIEFVIGLFGFVSLQIFDWVGPRFTAATRIAARGISTQRCHHILVALVIHLLKQEQPHHQPHRLGRTTLLAVILPKDLFKIPPRNSLSQLSQGVSGLTLLIECRHQKRLD